MRYDAIIIGSGQAGVPLAEALVGKGWHVALAESDQVGGTCVNYGCSPTKTIIASARAAYVARRSADFGVQTGEVTIDFAKVMQRQHDIVHQFRSGVEKRLKKLDRLTLYRDHAQLESDKRVRVGDTVIESDRIYINTGGSAVPPSIPGLQTVPYLNNKSILELKELPTHLIVIGGGYIGLEFAQAFRRFGSQVTVLEHGKQLLAKEDADVGEAVLQILENEAVKILLNSEIQKVERKAKSVMVTVKEGDKTQEIVGSHLLLATGIKPNSHDLGLEAVGVQIDEHGYITVDDHLQTNVSGIWALGDVNGRGAFTHTSYNDYEIALDNLNEGKRKLSDRIPVYAVYIDPPLGRVGMTEKEVRKSGRKALIGVKPMKDIARALERDETQGFMKVLIDAETEQFLGAAILGIGGDEIVHSIIDLMYAKASYRIMQNAVHIHPTVSELLPTLLGELKPLK